ncbi:hypothetical protein HRI_003136500 [Hibiscus trionum]|uniref:Secreted protein n=1 Tax=Hibiscus trionum TaxID=183268 RepID=A0A9W7IGE2_HIBTR|nr:hypothetical protein HRI_003136500 [Hibiscus trionum]
MLSCRVGCVLMLRLFQVVFLGFNPPDKDIMKKPPRLTNHCLDLFPLPGDWTLCWGRHGWGFHHMVHPPQLPGH